MQEQRRFKRADFRQPYQLDSERGQLIGACVACDLSAGGVRLRGEQFVPLHSRIRVKFAVEDGQPLILEGRVVWVQRVPHSEEYQIGVEFDESDTNMYPRSRIYRYIEPGSSTR